MTNKSNVPSVVVLGHRGGAGKSAVAAGLITEFARLGLAPLAFDFAVAGGVSSLNYSLIRGPEINAGGGSDASHVIHRHQALDAWFAVPRDGSSPTWEGVSRTAAWARDAGRGVVLHDFPVTSVEEFGPALKDASVALLVMPAEGLAFRSLPGLLERLQSERARPGRRFSVKAVLVESGLPSIERTALDAFLAEHLGPILLDARIPQDAGLRRAMSAGHLPDTLPAESPAAKALAKLAREVMPLLTSSEAVWT